MQDIKDKLQLEEIFNAINNGVGDIERLKVLLASGVNVNIKDENGNTPLHHAVSANNQEIVEVLLANGADINIQNKDGATPLYNAVLQNNQAMVKCLLDNAKDANINIQNKDGATPLHHAVLVNNQAMVEVLIAAKGANINIQNNYGATQLKYAIMGHNTKMIKCLLDNAKGADINLQDRDGKTPLHYAVLAKNQEIIEVMLAKSADINIQDRDGNTILHIIIKNGNSVALEYLINGNHINENHFRVINKEGLTPVGHLKSEAMRDMITERFKFDLINEKDIPKQDVYLPSSNIYDAHLKNRFVYLKKIFDKPEFLTDVTNILSAVDNQFSIDDCAFGTKTFVSSKEMQDFLSEQKSDAEFYYAFEEDHLRLYTIKSKKLTDIFKNVENNRGDFSTTKIKSQGSRFRFTEDNIPSTVEEFIKLVEAVDLRKQPYNLIVHSFKTNPDSLSDLLHKKEIGGNGFLDIAPFVSASFIDNATPMATMQHQNNALPTMALILDNPFIMQAVEEDFYSGVRTKFIDKAKTVAVGIVNHIKKPAKIKEIKRHIASKYIKNEDKDLFNQEWQTILNATLPNNVEILLPYGEAPHSYSHFKQPDISNKKSLLDKTNHGKYNELLLLANGMIPSNSNKTAKSSGIAIEAEALETFLDSLKFERKSRNPLIENFNMILDLGLPIVIVKTNVLENTKKCDPKFRPVRDRYAEATKCICGHVRSLHFLSRNKNANQLSEKYLTLIKKTLSENSKITDIIEDNIKKKNTLSNL